MSETDRPSPDERPHVDVPGSLALEDGLYLRPLTLGDAPGVFLAVDADRADLSEWLPWVAKTETVADTLRYVEESLRRRRDGSAYVYGVWQELDFCGVIDLHAVDTPNGNAQIGYWLKPAARGHGLMTGAAVAMVSIAFEIVGLERVEIRVAVGNDKSAAIPIRLGFQHEGTLRHAQLLDSGYADLNIYGLLAGEYRRSLGGLAEDSNENSANEIEGGLEF